MLLAILFKKKLGEVHKQLTYHACSELTVMGSSLYIYWLSTINSSAKVQRFCKHTSYLFCCHPLVVPAVSQYGGTGLNIECYILCIQLICHPRTSLIMRLSSLVEWVLRTDPNVCLGSSPCVIESSPPPPPLHFNPPLPIHPSSSTTANLWILHLLPGTESPICYLVLWQLKWSSVSGLSGASQTKNHSKMLNFVWMCSRCGM